MAPTATDPGVCVRCGEPRRWCDVLDVDDDGLCGPCYSLAWSGYLAEVAQRGKKEEKQ